MIQEDEADLTTFYTVFGLSAVNMWVNGVESGITCVKSQCFGNLDCLSRIKRQSAK